MEKNVLLQEILWLWLL